MRIKAEPWPKPPPLTEGDLHVWVAELAATDLDCESEPLLDLLDSEERHRAERFHHRHDGARWAGSRALLRALLGGYLDRDPATLRFASGERGKPRVQLRPRSPADDPPPDPNPQLHFNLSHSGGFAVYAVALDQPVGVDVEALDRDFDPLAIARRAFDADCVRRLRELSPAEQKHELIRLWVRHEASLKCLGLGLGDAEAFARGPRPWVAELDAADGMLAAVAAQREPATVVYNGSSAAPRGRRTPGAPDPAQGDIRGD